MTKPTKPEFTDYASAMAYLKAGRDPNERPTKAGWNTRLVLTPDGPALVVKGGTIATYLPDGYVRIKQPSWEWVARERLQDYVLRPRNMTMSGYDTIVMYPKVAHDNVTRVKIPIYRFTFTTPSETIELDHRGVRGNPARVSDEELHNQVIRWCATVAATLTGSGILATSTCLMCRTNSDQVLWGDSLSDPEHLFAHIFATPFSFAPLFVKQVLAASGISPTYVPSGMTVQGVDVKNLEAIFLAEVEARITLVR